MEGKTNSAGGSLAIGLGIFFGVLTLALAVFFGVVHLYTPITNLSESVSKLTIQMNNLSKETEGIVSKMDELSKTGKSIERSMRDLPTTKDLWAVTYILSKGRSIGKTTLSEWAEAQSETEKIHKYLRERPE